MVRSTGNLSSNNKEGSQYSRFEHEFSPAIIQSYNVYGRFSGASIVNFFGNGGTPHHIHTDNMGPFKCYVTLFSGNWTPTHPLVTLITLNLTPS